MFYKRLCDQWEWEADDAIAEQERQQGRTFTEAQKAIFRARGEHRYAIPDGSRWGDVKAVSVNIGEDLTRAMRAVADANDELRGVFTVDWNQPAPDGSGKPLIANEVVHALVQHFDEHDLSNRNVPADVLGRAYEYLIKKSADDAGAKACKTDRKESWSSSRVMLPLCSTTDTNSASDCTSSPLPTALTSHPVFPNRRCFICLLSYATEPTGLRDPQSSDGVAAPVVSMLQLTTAILNTSVD